MRTSLLDRLHRLLWGPTHQPQPGSTQYLILVPTVIRSHKIRLVPNKAQEVLFRKAVGAARFAYNWALAEWKRQYAEGLKPSEGEMRKHLNAVKRVEFPWMYEVPKTVVQQAVKNLGTAFGNLFAKRGKYPKFKQKHGGHQAARLDDGPGSFRFDGLKVKLPIIGWVKMREELRWLDGRPISAVLRLEGGKWFLSVAIQIELPEKGENQALPSVGLDLGLTSAVTLSTGEKLAAPAPLRRELGKLAMLNRSMARKVKGSSNWKKEKARVGQLHWRIAAIRRDWQHKTTTMLTARFGTVCMEDLNVKGMMGNHCLARSISDVGWGELKRQLSYKGNVVEVGRFFPSSKTCSCCGHVVQKLPLKIRTWVCEKCGSEHDRDHNATVNILTEGTRILAGRHLVINRGEGGADAKQVASVKPPSVKRLKPARRGVTPARA